MATYFYTKKAVDPRRSNGQDFRNREFKIKGFKENIIFKSKKIDADYIFVKAIQDLIMTFLFHHNCPSYQKEKLTKFYKRYSNGKDYFRVFLLLCSN